MRGMYGHRCAHVKDLLQPLHARGLRARRTRRLRARRRAAHRRLRDGLQRPSRQEAVHEATSSSATGRSTCSTRPTTCPTCSCRTPWRARCCSRTDAGAARRAGLRGGRLAKRDLKAGEIARRHGRLHLLRAGRQLRQLPRRERYLPMSLSVDCRLKRDIAKDQPIRYDDVVAAGGPHVRHSCAPSRPPTSRSARRAAKAPRDRRSRSSAPACPASAPPTGCAPRPCDCRAVRQEPVPRRPHDHDEVPGRLELRHRPARLVHEGRAHPGRCSPRASTASTRRTTTSS